MPRPCGVMLPKVKDTMEALRRDPTRTVESLMEEFQVTRPTVNKVKKLLGIGLVTDEWAKRGKQIIQAIRRNPKKSSSSLAEEFEVSIPTVNRLRRKIGLSAPKGHRVRGVYTKNVQRVAKLVKGVPHLSTNFVAALLGVNKSTVCRIKRVLGLPKIRAGRPRKDVSKAN